MIKRTIHFSKPAHLSLKLGQLVIKILGNANESGSIITRPIEDIGLIILESPAITMTSMLLAALLENNVAVVTCNAQHLPCGMFLNLNGNTIQTERFIDQIQASTPLKKQLWQQTVSAKIANQSALLKEFSREETGCMGVWAKSVKSGDTNNLEGRAAAFYWRNIFENIPGFKRGREESPPNNLLNYGYAILRAVLARSLVGSGLLPTLGIHHHNRYNSYCLADDIMEPYRPYVDRIVLKILMSSNPDLELNKETKTQLLNIPVEEVKINGLRRPLMVAASMTSASLVRCFAGEIRKISYPEL